MPEDRSAHLCTVAVGTNQDQPRVTVDVKGERNMMRKKMIFMKRKLMKEKHHIWWFPEIGLPQNHGFNGVFHYKPTILDTPPFVDTFILTYEHVFSWQGWGTLKPMPRRATCTCTAWVVLDASERRRRWGFRTTSDTEAFSSLQNMSDYILYKQWGWS